MSSYHWVSQWLSVPRWDVYLQACSDNPRKALELYEWNLELASAIMHDIAHIEVAVRNIYDQTLAINFLGTEHWLFDHSSPVIAPLLRNRRGRTLDLNARNRTSIEEARRRHNSIANPGKIIAELPFGFWRHLTDSAHEKTLWVPYLNKAFPKGTNRKKVEQALTLINEVRNRASHHEPLFTPGRLHQVTSSHQTILDLASMLLPPLEQHISSTTKVPQHIATLSL